MSDAVVADAKPTEDTIELDGRKFVVVGAIREQNVAEFATGLKIGPATYDEREHAFWAVLDDFSGGFGFRVLNIREALGTHFDNPGGVDLRRARHITLPPEKLTLSPDFQTSASSLFFTQHSIVVTDVGGTEYMHIGVGDSIYTLDSNRTSLTRRAKLNPTNRTINRIHRLLVFKGSDDVRAIYACGFGDAGRSYWRTTDGVTWVEAGQASWPDATAKPIQDMIVFDGNLVAAVNNTIISSADGENWTTEDPNLGDGIIWRTGGPIIFIGVAMSPDGTPMPYFLDEGKLFALDFYAWNAIEVKELGDNLWLTDGTIWNGQIIVTNGQQIWAYNPAAGETVRNISPFGKEGAPDSWRNENWQITQFISGTSDLFALCRGGFAFEKSRLLVYTGTGWTWFGDEITDPSGATPWTSTIDLFPINWSTTPNTRQIHVATDKFGGGNFKLHSFVLPKASDLPYVGSGAQFADGPKSFVTGWFDGGFIDLEGVLIRMTADGFNIDEDHWVKVEYRLDNNESSQWTELGTFTRPQQDIWFSKDRRGVPFRTVQFRVTLDRGSDNTKTPELKSLVLVYDKKSPLRRAWAFRIDLAKTVHSGSFNSIEEAHDAIVSAWNTSRLVELKIPSIAPKGTNVRITEIIGVHSGFSKSDHDAIIDMTVVEPVA